MTLSVFYTGRPDLSANDIPWIETEVLYLAPTDVGVSLVWLPVTVPQEAPAFRYYFQDPLVNHSGSPLVRHLTTAPCRCGSKPVGQRVQAIVTGAKAVAATLIAYPVQADRHHTEPTFPAC
jgi:hypothetical protein